MITVDPHEEPWEGWDFCRCCGLRTMIVIGGQGDDCRCEDHRRRNPCAIEGCKRTQQIRKRGMGKGLDAWICADHWRHLIPPGSPERRIYLRFFRRARRHGWNGSSVSAFWRIWARIVALARKRANGGEDLERDVAEKMGW